MEALRGAVLGMSSFCSTQVSFVLTKSLGLTVMFWQDGFTGTLAVATFSGIQAKTAQEAF